MKKYSFEEAQIKIKQKWPNLILIRPFNCSWSGSRTICEFYDSNLDLYANKKYQKVLSSGFIEHRDKTLAMREASRTKDARAKANATRRNNRAPVAKKRIETDFPHLELLEYNGSHCSCKFMHIQSAEVFYMNYNSLVTGNNLDPITKREQEHKKIIEREYCELFRELLNEDSKRRSIQKVKETCLLRYGVSNTSQVPEIREKQRQTAIQNGTIKVYQELGIREWSEKLDVHYTKFAGKVSELGLKEAIGYYLNKSGTDIEEKIKDLLVEIGTEFVFNKFFNRKISTGVRPDFYLPDHNLIIECLGLYWHSDYVLKEDPKKDLKRFHFYRENGVRSLFFYANEILDKFHIIRSIILNKIGHSNKIFARKCRLVTLSTDQSRTFFTENHLMGKGTGETFALEYEGDIVMAVSIHKRERYLELNRACSKVSTTVVGGLSRILRHIEKCYPNNPIHSYVDLRYGDGRSLEQIGFRKISENVSFRWTDFRETFHRMRFPRNTGYDNRLSKIYDCGQALFVLNSKNSILNTR